MSTNYTRIPSENEMLLRKQQLIEDVVNMELSSFNVERGFDEPIEDTFMFHNPWSKFLDGTNVHIGLRSSGWKFLFNFHNNKYYSNKEELFKFIRSGRIVDEYGTEMDTEEFIKMSLEWCPDGLIADKEYCLRNSYYSDEYCDRIIDGLRVSCTTEFC